MRAKARAEKRPIRYDGTWRDRDPADAPAGVDPVIRFKAPLTGETVIDDRVQGEVRFENEQLDDMVLLRADGTPTYMLSVVVDDIDMGITHIIRGDDHLNNAVRHANLFRALGHEPPAFAHIPLIHGSDGAKLSKRHGALGVDAYRDLGYLPEAMRNYLLRLGWAHGDDEIISTEQAIAWFDLDAVGRSPARFDTAKLDSVNAHYLRERPDADLVALGGTAARGQRPSARRRGAGAAARRHGRAEAARPDPGRARRECCLPRPGAAAAARRQGGEAARRRPGASGSRRRCRRSRPPSRSTKRRWRPQRGRRPRRSRSASASWRSRCARRSPAGRCRPGFSR